MSIREQSVCELGNCVMESEMQLAMENPVQPSHSEYHPWNAASRFAQDYDEDELDSVTSTIPSVIAPEEPFNPDSEPEIDPMAPQPELPTPPPHPNTQPHRDNQNGEPNRDNQAPADPTSPTEPPPHISPVPPMETYSNRSYENKTYINNQVNDWIIH